MSWLDYWSDSRFDESFWRPRSRLYYEKIRGVVELEPSMRVMDYGAGPGYLGPYLSPRVKEVILAEKSLSLHERSVRINGPYENCVSFHVTGLESLGTFLDRKRLDLILMHSVLQYIPKGEVRGLFEFFSDYLQPGGKVLVSDVVPKDLSFVRELISVFTFYIKSAHFFSFIRFFSVELSKYFDRSKMELSMYSKEEILEAFSDGFRVHFVENPSISKKRLAFLLEKV